MLMKLDEKIKRLYLNISKFEYKRNWYTDPKQKLCFSRKWSIYFNYWMCSVFTEFGYE
jgi:hypothetical protein